MKFNHIVEVFIPASLNEDPFGGYNHELESVGMFNSFILPAQSVLTLVDGNIVSIMETKLFTKDMTFPEDATLIVHGEKRYEILAFVNYGKIIMVKLKEV